MAHKGLSRLAVGASGYYGAEEMMREAGKSQFGDALAIFALTN